MLAKRWRSVFFCGSSAAFLGFLMPSTAATQDKVAAIKHGEHCRALDLVPVDKVTHRALGGLWSKASTWADGRKPDAGARVLIPRGVEVVVDAELAAIDLASLRVDGSLRFAPDKTTSLSVVTLIVTDDAKLEIGSAKAPIKAQHSATLYFADRGPRDRRGDPLDLGGGLIATGSVSIVGAACDGVGVSKSALTRGKTALQLRKPATGWRAGDRLLFASTRHDTNEDEVVPIAAVSDDKTTITLAKALRFDHVLDADHPMPIGNLTRNVRIVSKNDRDLGRRGHIMLMHQQSGIRIENAAFEGLGRTDARRAHTFPKTAKDGTTLPGSDSNSIGRYALHFHIRFGARRDRAPHLVRNCAIVDSPKHGLVNHGGHVVAEGNVAYRCHGSQFFTENGSEIGAFRGNLAVRSNGSTDGAVDSRCAVYDHGHEGVGFWLQSAGVDVSHNWSFGQRYGGFFYFTQLFRDGGIDVEFCAANLRDPSIAKGKKTIATSDVPLPLYPQRRGRLQVWHRRVAQHDVRHAQRAEHHRRLSRLQLELRRYLRPLLQGPDTAQSVCKERSVWPAPGRRHQRPDRRRLSRRRLRSRRDPSRARQDHDSRRPTRVHDQHSDPTTRPPLA